MDKHRTVERLCQLVSQVGSKIFHSKRPHDCFCDTSLLGGSATIDEKIIAYIEDAVRIRMDLTHHK